MVAIIHYHKAIAVFIVRRFLDFLFFFQSNNTVFNVKNRTIIATNKPEFSNREFPDFLIKIGINVIITTIAFSITLPTWDMRFVFPLLTLIALFHNSHKNTHLFERVKEEKIKKSNYERELLIFLRTAPYSLDERNINNLLNR